MARKIEARQAKKGEDKGRQGKGRAGTKKEEAGKGVDGKDVEKCVGGDLWPGGGGVRPTLRGILHWIIPPRVELKAGAKRGRCVCVCVLGCVMDDGKDVPKIGLKMSKN